MTSSSIVSSDMSEAITDTMESLVVSDSNEDSKVPLTDSAANVSSSEKDQLHADGKLRMADDRDPLINPYFKSRQKHVFVFSESGKPIFSRYGDEGKLSDFIGVMTGLMLFAHREHDEIREIVAGDSRSVFLAKGSLYYCMVCSNGEMRDYMLKQIEYIHGQILSILTEKAVNDIFARSSGYDLRSLLGGTESCLSNLIKRMSMDPSFLFGSYVCLRLPVKLRMELSTALHVNRPSESNLLFALVFARTQLAAIVRVKKYKICPEDMLLLSNFISSSASFRSSESWTPICLPKFADGFLYAYISYLSENICLVFITATADAFYALSECKSKLLTCFGDVDTVSTSGLLSTLHRTSEENYRFKVGDTNIPELLHFVYVAKSYGQMVMPEFEAPFAKKKERKRLFRIYQLVHARMHDRAILQQTAELKTFINIGQTEIVYGSSGSAAGSDYELYATFGPFLSKDDVFAAVSKLLKWLKREEDTRLIMNPLVW